MLDFDGVKVLGHRVLEFYVFNSFRVVGFKDCVGFCASGIQGARDFRFSGCRGSGVSGCRGSRFLVFRVLCFWT